MNSGIYRITNKKNQKNYIGSSSRLNRRGKEHFKELRDGVHKNPYLQKAWDKHGEKAFEYVILELCEREFLLACESKWIEAVKSWKRVFGYNLCRYPQSYALGIKRSPETIAKMSAALSGENHPCWGKKLPKSQVKKMADAQRGVSKPTSGKRKTYKVVLPNGKTVKINGLREFCRKNGFSPSMVLLVINGEQKEYKGLTRAEI